MEKNKKKNSMPFLQRGSGHFSSAGSRCTDCPPSVQAEGFLTPLRVKEQEKKEKTEKKTVALLPT